MKILITASNLFSEIWTSLTLLLHHWRTCTACNVLDSGCYISRSTLLFICIWCTSFLCQDAWNCIPDSLSISCERCMPKKIRDIQTLCYTHSHSHTHKYDFGIIKFRNCNKRSYRWASECFTAKNDDKVACCRRRPDYVWRVCTRHSNGMSVILDFIWNLLWNWI